VEPPRAIGKRSWLRPRYYIVGGRSREWTSLWPFTLEWRLGPDPERICARCGSDQGNGFLVPDADLGQLCLTCYSNVTSSISPWLEDEFAPWRSRMASRVRSWPPGLLDHAYWWWCRLFGKRVVQEAPPASRS
jgi:hypothetical protein